VGRPRARWIEKGCEKIGLRALDRAAWRTFLEETGTLNELWSDDDDLYVRNAK
jgi:hypothetical protein